MDIPDLELERWFGPGDLDRWRELARATIHGRNPDTLIRPTAAGVALRPLDVDRPASAGLAGRGGAWQVRQEVRGPGPRTAAGQLKADQARGGDAPWIRVDRATRLGRSPADAPDADDAVPALSIVTAADLHKALEPVDLSATPIVLEAGANGPALHAALCAVADDRGVDTAALTGALHTDPAGTLMADGALPRGIAAAYDDVATLLADDRTPDLRVLAVSGLPASEAGADAATELAVVLGALVEALRRLEARGHTPDAVLPRIEVLVGLGGHLLLDLAKLRALRRLWARLAAACGVDGARPFIHARQLDATLATVDPWTNLLRSSSAGFVGASGGADAITLLPWDHALGASEAHARRVARNQQILLREEAHLDRVEDPGAGIYVEHGEHLTDGLCSRGNCDAACAALEVERALCFIEPP